MDFDADEHDAFRLTASTPACAYAGAAAAAHLYLITPPGGLSGSPLERPAPVAPSPARSAAGAILQPTWPAAARAPETLSTFEMPDGLVGLPTARAVPVAGRQSIRTLPPPASSAFLARPTASSVHLPEADRELTRLLRAQRNREAAQRSRRKTKLRTRSLEGSAHAAVQVNEDLRTLLAALLADVPQEADAVGGGEERGGQGDSPVSPATLAMVDAAVQGEAVLDEHASVL